MQVANEKHLAVSAVHFVWHAAHRSDMTISSVVTQPVLILEVPSLYLEQLRPLVAGALLTGSPPRNSKSRRGVQGLRRMPRGLAAPPEPLPPALLLHRAEGRRVSLQPCLPLQSIGRV